MHSWIWFQPPRLTPGNEVTRPSIARTAVTAIAMLLLGTAFQPAAAQQTLLMDNGDRFTGVLRSIEGKVWVFKLPVGETKIPARRVVSFVSPRPIGVRLADGTIAAAAIQRQDAQLLLKLADGSTRVISPTEIEAVGDPADLDALVPVPIGFFTPLDRFWSAGGSLGFSDKTGNSRARGISTSIEIQRRTDKDRLRFTAGLNREQSLSSSGVFEPTVAKYYAALRADIYFTERFFTFAETRQDRDTFQDIALRSSYNGGAGVQLVSTNTTDLRLSASGGTRIERYVANGRETAAVLKTGTEARQKLGPVTVDWQLNWMPNVEDFTDYQLRSEASITTTVFKGLGFRLGLLNEFDSEPRPGVEKHDMLVTTTIAYSIGR